MSVRGHIAVIRFGLGLRLGEAPPADPEAWLLGQLRQAEPPPAGPTSAEALAIHNEATRARRANEPEAGRPVALLAREEAVGWGARRLTAAQPFRERLVDFWFNHFTVSRRNGYVRLLAGCFEREAIRPHVTGRFVDLLTAAAQHPAMLHYLDNIGSIGPNSRLGRRNNRGLNENLAREILELHTLSPAAGYTQGDVQEFARTLTGWAYAVRDGEARFQFRPGAHEPGPKSLLGRRFAEGLEGGLAALQFLAEHPATLRHLAVKLARHFVADDPPPEAVRAVEAALRDSKGDLGAAAAALVRLPQAWEPPLSKFRAPADFVVAATRAVGIEPDRAEFVIGGLAALSQPLWTAPQPNGWADTQAAWAAPEALMRRVDWAYTLAGRAGRIDAGAAAEAALGPLARAETVAEMRRAGAVRDALTLLFGSPEFMHR